MLGLWVMLVCAEWLVQTPSQIRIINKVRTGGGRVSRLLTHTAKSVVESKLCKRCLVLRTAEDCARWAGLLLSAGDTCPVS